MNKIIYMILFLFLTSINLLADNDLAFFTARSDNDFIEITWQSNDETNVSRYIIERKTSKSAFMEIGELEAKGDNSFYTFQDENAYKGNDIVFIYRLKIIDNEGAVSGYSKEVTVSHTTSVGKRTWGSIKALFR